MTDTLEAVDPRTERPGICGVVQVGATGIEWVCIKEVHATEDDVRQGREKADRHYFVNRWPNRPRAVSAASPEAEHAAWALQGSASTT